MNLANFETSIPPAILELGQEYFRDKAVDSLEELAQGRWEAIVVGNEEYTVQIAIEDEQVPEWSCTCPYDKGPVCKHVVATLLAIREAEQQPAARKETTARPKAKAAPKTPKKPKAKPAPKPRTKPFSFNEMLDQLSFEELRGFVREKHGKDKNLVKEFLLYFADKDPNIDLAKLLRERFRQIVKNHSSRGFLYDDDIPAFILDISEVVNTTMQTRETGNFRQAIRLGQMVCEELVRVLDKSHDSEEMISDLHGVVAGYLEDLARDERVEQALVEKLMTWAEAALENIRWNQDGAFIATLNVARACSRRGMEKRYLDLLGSVAEAGEDYEYFEMNLLGWVLKEQIEVLRDLGKVREAKALMKKNMGYFEVHMAAVDWAILDKDLVLAKKLLQELVDEADSEYEYEDIFWSNPNAQEVALIYGKLKEIALLENDTESMIQILRKSVLGPQADFESYQEWKAFYSPEEWPAVRDAAIEEAIAEEKLKTLREHPEAEDKRIFHKLLRLLAEEELWEQLLGAVPRPPDMEYLMLVQPFLGDRYPKEITALLLEAVEQMIYEFSEGMMFYPLVDILPDVLDQFPQSRDAVNKLLTKLTKTYSSKPNLVAMLKRLMV